MKTFLALVKTNLNVNFGVSYLKHRFTVEKKRRWEPILIGLSILIGLGTLLPLYIFLLLGIFTVGLQINQPEIVLIIAILFTQFIVMFFGIFYLMSALYFSKDTNILVPLPLKPYQVLGSKIIVIIVNEYLTALPILLPAVIIYGIGMQKGLYFWLKSILIILITPIVPLNISAFFIIILMRFVNFRKSKDILAVVGGLLGIILGLGLNLFIQKIPQGNEEKLIENIITKQYGLINHLGQKFPPSLWAVNALMEDTFKALGFLLLFIIVSLLMFLVLLWLGNFIFYKSLLSGQEISRKRKILSKDEWTKQFAKASNPIISIFFREWKLLLRTPVYVLNCLTGIIIGPFMVALFMLSGGSGQENLVAILKNPDYSFYIQLGGLALMLYISGLNIAASTTVSREGSMFWISKMIPISARHQVLAKFFNGLTIASLGVVTTGIMLSIFILPLQSTIPIIILGIVGSISLTAFNIMVDMSRPKLIWDNPQEAVKQNINSLLGMLISFLMLGLLAIAAVLMIKAKMSPWVIYLILGLFMSGLGIVGLSTMLTSAEKRYGSIEI